MTKWDICQCKHLFCTKYIYNNFTVNLYRKQLLSLCIDNILQLLSLCFLLRTNKLYFILFVPYFDRKYVTKWKCPLPPSVIISLIITLICLFILTFLVLKNTYYSFISGKIYFRRSKKCNIKWTCL